MCISMNKRRNTTTHMLNNKMRNDKTHAKSTHSGIHQSKQTDKAIYDACTIYSAKLKQATKTNDKRHQQREHNNIENETVDTRRRSASRIATQTGQANHACAAANIATATS